MLRPGGRLTLSVWGVPERNPWAAILPRMLVERGDMPPPEPGVPGPFSMADEARTRALLEGAGFGTIRTEEVPVRWAFRDLDEFLAFAADVAPFAMLLRRLPESERDAIKAQLAAAFGPFLADGEYVLPGVALCVVAG